MDELDQLRRELEIARAEAEYYRNLVLLDENDPDSIRSLDESQDTLDRLDPSAAGSTGYDAGAVLRSSGTPTLQPEPVAPVRKGFADRLRYLVMIPVNIIVAIPVSIVAAVALARIMSASLLKKGFLDVLVKNASQSVRISVDQHRNDREGT